MIVAPATVLVTGASGFIGRPLVERLAASGSRVIALTRRADVAFPAGVRVRAADLATGAGIDPGLFDGVDVIYHCAGDVRRTELMRELHVGGVARLLEARRGGTPRAPMRWVQVSSVGAYGPAAVANHPRRIDETSPEHPAGEYEVTKTEADRLVRRAAADGLFSLTMLRPANVIGPRMPNQSLPRIVSMVRRGLFVRVGKPGAIANYVHVDDVVAALAALGSHPAAIGEVFNLSSDCPWDGLIDRIASAAGVRPPRVRVPEGLLRVLGGPVGARLGNPLTSTRVNALVGRTSYPSAKIESVLGFHFGKPMPAGIDGLVTGAA
jgi:nucleoside-diphosphate-sugar epimerase